MSDNKGIAANHQVRKSKDELEQTVNPTLRVVTGVVTEATNVGLFSLFLKQNLEKMLFKLPLHVSLFPILVTLSFVELVYKVREARIAHVRKIDGWQGTVLVASAAIVGFLAVLAATVVSFLFASVLSPALFVGSIALSAVVHLGLAVYYLGKAISNWGCKQQRDVFLKKAAANAVTFVLGGIIAATIGVLMIAVAPAISKLWAGIGIAVSAVGLGIQVPWRKMRDKVKGWYKRSSVDLTSDSSASVARLNPATTPAPTSVASGNYNNTASPSPQGPVPELSDSGVSTANSRAGSVDTTRSSPWTAGIFTPVSPLEVVLSSDLSESPHP